jgi:hypothetical protein
MDDEFFVDEETTHLPAIKKIAKERIEQVNTKLRAAVADYRKKVEEVKIDEIRKDIASKNPQ